MNKIITEEQIENIKNYLKERNNLKALNILNNLEDLKDETKN